MGIRSYGPGKFDHIIDGYAYAVTNDGGANEDASYPDGGGWYGLLLLDGNTRDAIRKVAEQAEDELTEEEEELIDGTEAVILCERSDGIVEVDWYDDRKDALEEWKAIAAEVEGTEAEGEDSDEGAEDAEA